MTAAASVPGLSGDAAMSGIRVKRAAAAVMALLLLTGACSSGSGDAAKAKNASTLYPLATNVDAATGAAGPFKPGHKGDRLAPGDRVRTDATGHAEINWPDKSLTRLGPATTLRISSLARPDKSQVKLQLDVGQTWNRVQRVTGSGGFDVETPVGVATVRGTRFAVTCTTAPACTFQVVDGTVAVTPTGGATILVTAGQTLSVQPGVAAGAPQTVGTDTLNNDPFIAENQRLDALPASERSTTFAATTTTTGTARPTTSTPLQGGGPSPTAPSRELRITSISPKTVQIGQTWSWAIDGTGCYPVSGQTPVLRLRVVAEGAADGPGTFTWSTDQSNARLTVGADGSWHFETDPYVVNEAGRYRVWVNCPYDPASHTSDGTYTGPDTYYEPFVVQ